MRRGNHKQPHPPYGSCVRKSKNKNNKEYFFFFELNLNVAKPMSTDEIFNAEKKIYTSFTEDNEGHLAFNCKRFKRGVVYISEFIANDFTAKKKNVIIKQPRRHWHDSVILLCIDKKTDRAQAIEYVLNVYDKKPLMRLIPERKRFLTHYRMLSSGIPFMDIFSMENL